MPEDKDDPEYPNMFLVGGAQPSLEEVLQAFPLPGEYIFRFRARRGKEVFWEDVRPGQPLPLFEGRLVAKVTRLQWGQPRQDPRPSPSPPPSQPALDLLESARPRLKQTAPSEGDLLDF